VPKFLKLLKGTNGKKLFTIIRYYKIKYSMGTFCPGRESIFVTVRVYINIFSRRTARFHRQATFFLN